MVKDAFIKLWNFLSKLYLPTSRTYFPAFLPNFFAGVLEHNLLNNGKVGRVNLLIFLLDRYFVWKQSPFGVQMFLLMF